MALSFPYTYISCPCSDASRRVISSKRASREVDLDEALEEDDSTFNPASARAAFSLFPPEHLFYCEDCRDLKCPRCVVEEIVCTFCPQCLFESVPSQVKAERNRCPRNCYTCPICQSQLNTSTLTSAQSTDKPYVLACQYCMWTSLDCGISFASGTGIRQQMEGKDRDVKDTNRSSVSRPKLNFLDQSSHARAGSSSLIKEYTTFNDEDKQQNEDKTQPTKVLDPHTRFNALKSFYKDQLLASDSSQSSSNLDAFSSSPSSLSRLMSLYGTGTGGPTSILGRKAKQRSTIMREALTSNEGLQLSSTQPPRNEAFDYLSTPTPSQLNHQYPLPLGNPSASNTSSLKPMPTLLRTKRSKRCATCKHILVKPELKVTSTRYRIKLIALNYIPFVSLKPVPVTGGPLPAGPDGDPNVRLAPARPSQWILTLRNPLFENVNVSLGSPRVTPGKHSHKVTILCPEFSIGKNGDLWDDASLTAQPITGMSRSETATASANEQVAGKVYEKGRNWTSVVVEVVPSSIVKGKGDELTEDEDVVEVPVRVRLEWKVTDEQALRDASSGKKGEDGEVDDGNRELAYWMVLGIGRVG